MSLKGFCFSVVVCVRCSFRKVQKGILLQCGGVREMLILQSPLRDFASVRWCSTVVCLNLARMRTRMGVPVQKVHPKLVYENILCFLQETRSKVNSD